MLYYPFYSNYTCFYQESCICPFIPLNFASYPKIERQTLERLYNLISFHTQSIQRTKLRGYVTVRGSIDGGHGRTVQGWRQGLLADVLGSKLSAVPIQLLVCYPLTQNSLHYVIMSSPGSRPLQKPKFTRGCTQLFILQKTNNAIFLLVYLSLCQSVNWSVTLLKFYPES